MHHPAPSPAISPAPVDHFAPVAPAASSPVLAPSANSPTYVLLRSGPDVLASEVELPHANAVEVLVSWGTNVLHVAHLAPQRDFVVGDAEGAEPCDFCLPADVLGSRRLALVRQGSEGPRLVFPSHASGHLERPDHAPTELHEVAGLSPSAEYPGALEVPLPAGARARIQLGDFQVQVAAVKAGKPIQRSLAAAFDWEVASYFGTSLLTFGGLIAALAYFVPPLGLEDDESHAKDRVLLMHHYLNAAAEREQEQTTSETTRPPEQEGATGTRAIGEAGALGKPSSQATNKHYAVKGPPDNTDVRLARAAALEEARTFGMISMLSGDPNAPTAPWADLASLGNAEFSSQGSMWGDEPGDSYGTGGLDLSGTGSGAGGKGFGIGMGEVGGFGHGAGIGTGQGFGPGGWGHSGGRQARQHVAKAPRMVVGSTTVSGRLPPEVIQRVVRQNFGRFRMCYEQGLARNPNLEGRVGVRFVIGRDGAVSNVSNGGSDLPDHSVRDCVISAFYGISFPPPEDGIVTIVYPLMFTPG